MDKPLIRDISHFFDVFKARTIEELKRELPAGQAAVAEAAVSRELDLLYSSLIRRIEESLNG